VHLCVAAYAYLTVIRLSFRPALPSPQKLVFENLDIGPNFRYSGYKQMHPVKNQKPTLQLGES
jgi:hypothetical protein